MPESYYILLVLSYCASDRLIFVFLKYEARVTRHPVQLYSEQNTVHTLNLKLKNNMHSPDCCSVGHFSDFPIPSF
jgi:hypothetical protein